MKTIDHFLSLGEPPDCPSGLVRDKNGLCNPPPYSGLGNAVVTMALPGAILGALVGGLAGLVMGRPAKGAAIGAGVGAATAGAALYALMSSTGTTVK